MKFKNRQNSSAVIEIKIVVTWSWQRETSRVLGWWMVVAYFIRLYTSECRLYCMSWSTWAAETKCHGLGSLNRNVLLTLLKLEKSEIKALADSVPGGNCFSAEDSCLLAESFHCFVGKEENELSGVSSYKYTNLIRSGPHLHDLI